MLILKCPCALRAAVCTVALEETSEAVCHTIIHYSPDFTINSQSICLIFIPSLHNYCLEGEAEYKESQTGMCSLLPWLHECALVLQARIAFNGSFLNPARVFTSNWSVSAYIIGQILRFQTNQEIVWFLSLLYTFPVLYVRLIRRNRSIPMPYLNTVSAKAGKREIRFLDLIASRRYCMRSNCLSHVYFLLH